MPSFDPACLLNQHFFAMEFGFMIGDLKDFLDTSEQNIEQQYHSECEAIQRGAEKGDPLYVEHLQRKAEHRFKVSLPLRVRYGAVLGLTTSVEWSIKSLERLLRDPLSKCPNRQDKAVHKLSELNSRTRLGQDEVVLDYKALVHVRNCIAHAAGIVEYDKYRQQLPDEIGRLAGFSIDNWHFLGKHICIERRALDCYFDSIGQLVTAIHKACHEQDLLKRE